MFSPNTKKQRLSEWLALTKTEKGVIIFLITTLLIGAGIRLYKYLFYTQDNYNYSISDSIFTVHSSTADSLLSKQVENKKTELKQPGIVNINKATKLELVALPGIGNTIAERIIRHRDSIGRFRSADELLNIKGISKKKLEQIKQYITVQ